MYWHLQYRICINRRKKNRDTAYLVPSTLLLFEWLMHWVSKEPSQQPQWALSDCNHICKMGKCTASEKCLQLLKFFAYFYPHHSPATDGRKLRWDSSSLPYLEFSYFTPGQSTQSVRTACIHAHESSCCQQRVISGHWLPRRQLTIICSNCCHYTAFSNLFYLN